jgi:hypothetical protein
LTGTKDNAFSDNVFDNFVGRLGTFIWILAPPTSTLYHSPHFESTEVESAPDYNVTWRNILTQIHQTREAVNAQQLSIEDVSKADKMAAGELSSVFSEIPVTVPAPVSRAPKLEDPGLGTTQ